MDTKHKLLGILLGAVLIIAAIIAYFMTRAKAIRHPNPTPTPSPVQPNLTLVDITAFNITDDNTTNYWIIENTAGITLKNEPHVSYDHMYAYLGAGIYTFRVASQAQYQGTVNGTYFQGVNSNNAFVFEVA